jgi:IPT/TIG domain
MDMRLIYEKTSSTHDLNRSGRTPFRAPVLMLFALAVVIMSLAVAGPARAAGAIPTDTEVISGQPDGAFAATPAVASTEEPAVTEPATAITQNSGTLNGTLDPNGSAVTACEFEYGPTTTMENKIPCTQSLASLGTGTAAVPVSAVPTGLTPNTTYTFRLREESAGAPSFGQPLTFKTLASTPTVTAIEPTSGPALGGTAVKIKGTGFVSPASVTIGNAATSVVVVSETEITAKTAATAAGKDAVVVSDGNGTSPGGPTYTYLPAPTVTTIEPASGPALGGTAVKIKGTGFVSPATVTIGSAATSVTVVSATEIMAKTAATAAGSDAVVVADANGTSPAGPVYTYLPAPTVTSIEPTSGSTAGGAAVKIKGTGFVSPATVTIGSAATSVVVVSSTEITAKTAATAAGSDAVVVSDVNGSSTPGPTYTYIAPPGPTVTAIEPIAGPTTGGTAVKITGTGFVAGASVTIGSPAISVEVVSETEIRARTTATAAGSDAVVVSDANGTSTGGPSFTYEGAPTVTSVEPGSGSTSGGTQVTITGTNLIGAGVTFGATAAASVKVNSPTSLTATSPAGSHTVYVIVTTPVGTSAVGPSDEFTYIPPASSGGGGGTSGGTTGGTVIKPPSIASGLPAPVLTRTANVSTVVGRVNIRLPGSHVFTALSSARQIPYGTLIETVHGEISVTAATPGGGTERGQFFDGEFVLSQGSNGRVLATLSGGDFSVCPTPAGLAKARRAQVRSKFASRTHLVRRLWAEGHGNFSTKGRYAGAIVQGAQWLTEDMCEGTLILATRERVEVSDLVRHRHASLQTGGIYTAKPR